MVSFYEKLSFHLHNSFYISFFHISFSQFIFSQFIFSQFIFKVSHVEGNEVRPPEGIGDVLSASVDITTPETINLTTDPSVSLAPSSNSIITTTTDDNKPPYFVGQVFESPDEFQSSVESYCAVVGTEIRWKKTSNERAKSDPYISYRGSCPRSGTRTSTKKTDNTSKNARPTRDSLKVGCGWCINAAHEKMPNNLTRNAKSVRITSVSLEHTNGCVGGADPDMTFALKKRAGRKYPKFALDHLRKEVKGGRYGTHDVKSWLFQFGFKDATLEEATNLRYRLMKDKPIKNWKPDDTSTKEQMGDMMDYLHNEDLANEISAGSKESIHSLQLVHNGLKNQIEGYDFRTATDSEGRFSGTAWQTGRMRARLRKCGVMIFLDDTRFWNVMVSDHDGKSQTVMGAMTMCASHEAAGWVLKSLVYMSPFAAEIVKATMSDLGKLTSLYVTAMLQLSLTQTLSYHCYSYTRSWN